MIENLSAISYWAEDALVKFLTPLVTDLQFKVPDPRREGASTVGPPRVYGSYIPSDQTGNQTLTQETPSVLVWLHSGSSPMTDGAGYYEIDFELLLSVWDDASDYSGIRDLRTLIDLLFEQLAFKRGAGRFRLVGDLSWNILPNADRTANFVAVIDGKLSLGYAPLSGADWL